MTRVCLAGLFFCQVSWFRWGCAVMTTKWHRRGCTDWQWHPRMPKEFTGSSSDTVNIRSVSLRTIVCYRRNKRSWCTVKRPVRAPHAAVSVSASASAARHIRSTQITTATAHLCSFFPPSQPALVVHLVWDEMPFMCLMALLVWIPPLRQRNAAVYHERGFCSLIIHLWEAGAHWGNWMSNCVCHINGKHVGLWQTGARCSASLLPSEPSRER